MSGGEKAAEINQLPYLHRDLLQSFNFSGGKGQKNNEAEAVEEEEGLELSLGLSLNGRFGVDPKRGSNITRASSISNFPIDFEGKEGKRSSLYDAVLGRTCSLPVETEEWRKRKELQSLKRLEAKRKRMEKLKNVRIVRDKLNHHHHHHNNNKVIVGPPPLPPLIAKGNSVQFSSQGSIGSQGSGGASSGVSDLESQEIPGTNKTPDEGSPASGRSSVEQITDKPAEAAVKLPSPKAAGVGLEDKETKKNMMGDMPCVSTRGDGPDGRRINGFLYRYGKGEELKIICVCHGSFLSPAEFVRHGGGGDVENPLKHIVINPSLL